MRALNLILLLCAAILMSPATGHAQQAATLVADEVFVTGGTTLTASGNIEVLYDGSRLQAARVIYDEPTDRLRIEGPILLTGPDGEILTAVQADLDPQLENGVLLGARLVLNQQLQLAANQIDRVDGRYSQLYKTAVTSCQVCSGTAPLWEIRAEKVIYDEVAQQIYFENARFRVKGVPILAFPSLRLPAPDNARATGVLIPSIQTGDRLGFGLQVPYYVTLGDSRDVLLTPFLAGNTRTLEGRYRQAFRNGDVTVDGAVSSDDLDRRDGLRGYLFAEGSFAMADGLQLAFDIQQASDRAYLSDYNISDTDRLASVVALTRVTDDAAASASLSYYQTLRENEVTASLPPVVGAAGLVRRLYPAAGGTVTVTASADTLVRYGADEVPTGRDVTRTGASAAWAQDGVTGGGVVWTVTSALTADVYQLTDTTRFHATLSRVVPYGQVLLRYPLVRQNGRTRHVLEPVAALTWSQPYGDTPPNEDSTRTELDAGNLLALAQAPGQDVAEDGMRLGLGVTWTRAGSEGVKSSLGFGRILRSEADPAFTPTSGQSKAASDWLVAGQIRLPRGLTFDGRALLQDDADTTLATARVFWNRPDVQLAGGYIWQAADPATGRTDTVSEYSFDGAVQVTQAWNVGFDTRYDIARDAPARAGIEVGWQNECVRVSLSASRRYVVSTTVQPTTDYGLSVALRGFSARGVRKITPRDCQS
ncbi:LPS-assembly protein [Loktanella fryxellensis]|uniref:LPS-assembly protein LptD n=1 Tax=Loktanella fryxellensis TaxID=245187 RepID=A0A1H8F6N6_9RHOB|nr:LPS assembly protein LptD [Loktanella fryxellensis]SEN26718.1 LPS-assembly protein [Loktanella fryxellensis]